MPLPTPYIRLAAEMAIRDLKDKYRRTHAGGLWFVATPVASLCIYWVVFGYIFSVQWHDPSTKEPVGFMLPFLAGLLFYLFFSDVVLSSSTLFVSKRTYVVKSPFPIWVLWLGNLFRAGAHLLVNLFILMIVVVLEHRLSFAGIGWLALTVFSSLIFLAGLSLILSCLGPFIGDIGEGARLGLRLLFYAAPVAYPLMVVPQHIRRWLWLNPLTHIIEPVRNALVFNATPDTLLMSAFAITGLGLCGLSLWMFSRLKGVIPDVV
jgi:lipopolysaccharide transport system permease protein